MPETKHPLKVFLCHARADKQKVRELYRYLRKRGIQPWLDAEDLVGGQDWRVEIPKAIRASDAIIICLSKNSINREGFVQTEITFALEKALEIPPGRIFIVPARFEDCEVPDRLERFQWVDLFEEGGFRRLMKALRTRASQLERATVQVPESNESVPNLDAVSEAEPKTIEIVAREKEESEKAEKAAQEQLEREIAEKTRREEIGRKTAEEAARKKAKRETAQKAKHQREERRSAQIAALKTRLSKSFITLKSTLYKAIPFIRVISIIVILIVLFWVGSWVIPQVLSFVPTANPSVTLHPSATVAVSSSPIPFTKTIGPSTTTTKTGTPAATALPTEITDSKGVKMELVSVSGSDPFYMEKY